MQNILRATKSTRILKRINKNFSDYENFNGYQNLALQNFNKPGITLVRDKETARKVIDTLYKYKDRFFN